MRRSVLFLLPLSILLANSAWAEEGVNPHALYGSYPQAERVLLTKISLADQLAAMGFRNERGGKLTPKDLLVRTRATHARGTGAEIREVRFKIKGGVAGYTTAEATPVGILRTRQNKLGVRYQEAIPYTPDRPIRLIVGAPVITRGSLPRGSFAVKRGPGQRTASFSAAARRATYQRAVGR